MRRLVRAVLALLLVGTTGCQAISTPVSETDVDRALIVEPAPSAPPPEVTPSEPQPGFEQEPPKSQNP